MTIAVEGVSVVAIDGTPVVQTPGLCKKMKQLRWSLVLVFMVGFIATTPSSVIPQLQQDAYGNNSYVVAGAFSSAKGAALVVYAPIVGSVSDRVGRKATLTAVLALSAVPYLAYAVTQNFWIYSYVNCFLGLFDVALSLLMSTIADTDRSRNVAITANDRTNGMTESFALGSSLLFLGLSLSPFLGAFLSNEITFIVCSVMQVSIVFIAWFLYPRQDLPDAAEAIVVAPKEIKVLDKQKASLTRIFEAFRRFPQLRVIITVVALNAVAEQLLDKFLMLYLSMTLNFDTTNIAVVIAVLGLGGVFGMLFTVRALVKKWGNLGALRIALAFNVVICALYAFLPYAYPIFAITALSVVGMAVYPCACALAMRCTKEYDAGTAQGVTQGARMIASAVTPFAFGYFFDATENFEFPGIPFMAGGAFVFFSLCMTKFVDLDIIDGTVVQTETGVGSPLLNDNGTTAVRVADSTYDAPATDKAQI